MKNQTNQRPRRFARLLSVIAGASLLLAGTSVFAFTQDSLDGEMLSQAQPQQQQQQEHMHQPGERPGEPQVQPRAEVETPAVGVQQEVRELRQEIHGMRTQLATRGFSDFVEEYQRDQRFEQEVDHYTMRGIRLLTQTIGEFITPEDQQLKQQHKQLTQRVGTLGLAPFHDLIHERGGRLRTRQVQPVEPQVDRARGTAGDHARNV
ncbi:MAG: hypothetical protein ACNA8W_22180, partial [Bradymonadaceae bacterium]